MKYRLDDIVFQNDRYYLLFNDLGAYKLSENSNDKLIITDEENIGKITDCHISQALSVSEKVVLESKDNLNRLENAFRKLKNVYITTDN